MVQHFLLGPSRDTDEARELFVAKSSKPLGNIGWSGSRRVTQLVNEHKGIHVMMPKSALRKAPL